MVIASAVLGGFVITVCIGYLAEWAGLSAGVKLGSDFVGWFNALGAWAAAIGTIYAVRSTIFMATKVKHERSRGIKLRISHELDGLRRHLYELFYAVGAAHGVDRTNGPEINNVEIYSFDELAKLAIEIEEYDFELCAELHMNSPEFRRHLRVMTFAAVRTRQVTTCRF
jgi:hypothetical protein